MSFPFLLRTLEKLANVYVYESKFVSAVFIEFVNSIN